MRPGSLCDLQPFSESCGYPGLPRVQLQERKLRYEDVYPVLYMKYRLFRQTSHNGIKHLVVDEMQDYSRLQYLILKMMFPCRMTILGTKPRLWKMRLRMSWDFLPKIFGKEIRRIVMNKKLPKTLWRLLLMRISLQGLQIWICLIVMASQWKNYF